MLVNMNPTDVLKRASKHYPNAWKIVEKIRSEKGKGVEDWPSWCFMPMAVYYAIICNHHNIEKLNIDLIYDLPILSAMGAWRYSQGIYRFDKDVYKSLTEMDQKKSLPFEVFFRLPQWCVYIETQNMKYHHDNGRETDIYGFWCHLEQDRNEERTELRILTHTSDGCVSFPLHIGQCTLEESAKKSLIYGMNVYKEIGKDFPRKFSSVEDEAKKMAAFASPLVSLILYLCSDEPDIVDREEPLSKPKNPTPKKVKSGMRMFPPDKPKIFDVGKNTGEKLRQYYKNYDTISDGKRTVKPHLRKAHWHGYWTGARGGEERTFKYNWVHPVFVSSKKIKEIK